MNNKILNCVGAGVDKVAYSASFDVTWFYDNDSFIAQSPINNIPGVDAAKLYRSTVQSNYFYNITLRSNTPNVFINRVWYCGVKINSSLEVLGVLTPYGYGQYILCPEVDNIYTSVFVFPVDAEVVQIGYVATTKDGAEAVAYPKFPTSPNTQIFTQDLTALSNGYRIPPSVNVSVFGLVQSEFLSHFSNPPMYLNAPTEGTTWHIDLNIYKDISSQINN